MTKTTQNPHPDIALVRSLASGKSIFYPPQETLSQEQQDWAVNRFCTLFNDFQSSPNRIRQFQALEKDEKLIQQGISPLVIIDNGGSGTLMDRALRGIADEKELILRTPIYPRDITIESFKSIIQHNPNLLQGRSDKSFLNKLTGRNLTRTVDNLVIFAVGQMESLDPRDTGTSLIDPIIHFNSRAQFSTDTIDALIAKGMQEPSFHRNMLGAVLAKRHIPEGFIAKLAFRFLKQGNANLVKDILGFDTEQYLQDNPESRYAHEVRHGGHAVAWGTGRDPKAFMQSEQMHLKNYLRQNPDIGISYAINNNDDKLLEEVLPRSKDGYRNPEHLHQAVFLSHATTFEILLRNGYDPLGQNQDGDNFLIIALRKGESHAFVEKYLRVVEGLYDADEDRELVMNRLFAQNLDRIKDPFSLAVDSGFLKLVEMQPFRDVEDGYFIENISSAIANNNPAVLNFLLEKGKDRLDQDLLIAMIAEIEMEKDPILAKTLMKFVDYHQDKVPELEKEKLQQVVELVDKLFGERGEIKIDTLMHVFENLGADYLQWYFNSCAAQGVNIEGLIQGNQLLEKSIKSESYSRTTGLLLKYGANPLSRVEGKDGQEVNHIVLAVQYEQPDTFGILFNHLIEKEILDRQLLQEIANQVIKTNNDVLTQEFIKCLNSELLTSLTQEVQLSLLELTIDNNLLLELVNKVDDNLFSQDLTRTKLAVLDKIIGSGNVSRASSIIQNRVDTGESYLNQDLATCLNSEVLASLTQEAQLLLLESAIDNNLSLKSFNKFDSSLLHCILPSSGLDILSKAIACGNVSVVDKVTKKTNPKGVNVVPIFNSALAPSLVGYSCAYNSNSNSVPSPNAFNPNASNLQNGSQITYFDIARKQAEKSPSENAARILSLLEERGFGPVEKTSEKESCIIS